MAALDDADALMAEFAGLLSKISLGSASSADVARARDLKPFIDAIDARITKASPEWGSVAEERAEIWMADIPKSKGELSAKRDSILAAGSHLLQIAPHPFARGGVRAAYRARLRINGEGPWQDYVAKQFLEPHNQSRVNALDQLEENGVAKYLAEQWMSSPEGKREGKKITCIEAYAAGVRRGSEDVWYNLESTVDGKWAKWLDNGGGFCDPKAPALLRFAVWTHTFTGGFMMVTDLQGGETADGFTLTDPAVLCTDLKRFGKTNFHTAQMDLCIEAANHGMRSGAALGGKMASSYAPGFTRLVTGGFADALAARDRKRAAEVARIERERAAAADAARAVVAARAAEAARIERERREQEERERRARERAEEEERQRRLRERERERLAAEARAAEEARVCGHCDGAGLHWKTRPGQESSLIYCKACGGKQQVSDAYFRSHDA